MGAAKSVGRVIGLLLFVQLVGLTLPFILLLPVATAGSLEQAAGHAFQIRVAVLLLFANSALTIGIAIAAFPVVREYGPGPALWLLSASVIWFALQAVDNTHILSMLSLSQRFAEGGAANAELLGALEASVRSARRWAHYTAVLAIEAWFFVFYGVLFRLSLVPRPLAGFGVIMVITHAAGITLPMFLGYGAMPSLGFSLALSHLALGSWLLAKEFDAVRRPLPADGRGVGLFGV